MNKIINKISLSAVVIFAIWLNTGCEKKNTIEPSCFNYNSTDCGFDTTFFPLVNAINPLCSYSTVININNFKVDKDQINLGDEVTCTYNALSPNLCAATGIIITRATKNNQIELHTHLQLDTCSGCYKSTAASLVPVPVTYTWKPKEKGVFTLKFINIYGGDIKKEIHVN